MADTKYTYSIANDFPNQIVESSRLQLEVQDSSIVAALDRIDTDEDVIDIWFKAALSSGDEDILDALVTAHSGEELTQESLVKLDSPARDDGTIVVATNMFPRGSFAYFSGDGDDIENGALFGGTDFKVSHDGSGSNPKTVTWQFKDWISLAGAIAEYKNGAIGDYLSFRVYAPASPATENTGAGAYAKLAIGGGKSIFVPAGTPGAGDPDWDLNLTETLNENVDILKVSPIPAPNGDGFFTFSCCSNSMALTPGQGNCNIMDSEQTLANYVNKKWLLLESGQVEFLIPNSEPKKLAPNFKYEAQIFHGGGTNTIEIVWNMILAREVTAS